MAWFYRIAEKLGSFGVVIAALGCTACFPALGALASTLGLGFLSGFEGVFINKLLPIFAGLALLANIAGWALHRNHLRGFISILGPLGVLATLYPLWKYGWSTYLFYACLILMLTVSIWDIVKPAQKVCSSKDNSHE
jgi:mercuric ion transport protein